MPQPNIYSQTFESANILDVEVGTNCPQGGDTGHGGCTVFRLVNQASTDLSVGVNGNAPQSVESVEIVLGGDTECETFLEALKFAVKILNAQILLNRSH